MKVDFARSRRTEDHHLLALVDLHRDAAQHVEIAKPLVQFAHHDNAVALFLASRHYPTPLLIDFSMARLTLVMA